MSFFIFVLIAIKAVPIIKEFGFSNLFSTNWHPHNKSFGVLNFIIGSILVTLIALLIAVPLGVFTSIYISEYMPKKLRDRVRILIEALAGISPVIYGAWGVSFVVPIVSRISEYLQNFGFELRNLSGFSALSGGVVLSIMILPIIISISVEVLISVSIELKEASIALGATKWQSCKLILRKAFAGIVASVILATSRAFGETVAVMMVCGSSIKTTPKSIFDPVFPIP
ncbi:MAG: phosphate ABC transporter permease subunit PstC, partial [bacterium]|nr:phosphate ABC transporter permease subunit PstC [bacterium]